MKKDFEILPHTADIKIRVYGDTIAQLFIHALQGMFQVIGPIVPQCKKTGDRVICDELPKQHAVNVRSIDYDSLLVDFLSDCLYLSDVNNEAYLDATIHEITQQELHATIYGVHVQGFEVVEIKAVTYHDLHIHQVNSTWQTDIVFDI